MARDFLKDSQLGQLINVVLSRLRADFEQLGGTGKSYEGIMEEVVDKFDEKRRTAGGLAAACPGVAQFDEFRRALNGVEGLLRDASKKKVDPSLPFAAKRDA